MSAATAAQTFQTFAVIFKERMMDMPDELNAKKDIDEYSKKITKEIKEEAKNNKIEKAEKKKDEKKKKKNNLDKDGNEIYSIMNERRNTETGTFQEWKRDDCDENVS